MAGSVQIINRSTYSLDVPRTLVEIICGMPNYTSVERNWALDTHETNIDIKIGGLIMSFLKCLSHEKV